MNFVLTNAILLPLATLLLAPLIIHLFARAKPPVYEFSSVEFLRRVMRQSIRIKRPRSLIVLLLRTAVFLGLVGLFLKPVFFGGPRLGSGATQKNVVILVDATASMAAVEGTQTRFAAACAKATEVLSGLSGSDLADIIWMGTPNRAEFPAMGVNTAYLKKVLRSAAVTSEASDIGAAIDMAASLLEGKPGAREIYILSDFQSSAWTAQTPAAPPGVQIYPIKIGQTDLPNQALTSITVDPPNPLPGQEATVYCDIWNYSAESSLNTLFLRAGESPQTREIRLEPWQKASVSFRVSFDTPGERAITAALSEDAFPYDNERWALVDVVEHLHVGLYSGDPQIADYWRRAMNSLGWVKVESLNESQLAQPFDGDALLLCGWKGPTPEAQKVNEYLSRGGFVVWAPSRQTTSQDLTAITLLHGPANAQETVPLLWEKPGKPFHVAVADADNPVFKIFAGGVYGDPARATFNGRFRLPATLLSNGKSVLAYEDGIPALALFKGQGKLALWNLPLDREYTDWPSHSEFLSFFGELLFHNRRTTRALQSRQSLAGHKLVREFEGEVLDSDVRLEFNGQPLKTVRRFANNRSEFVAAESRVPGLYSWYYRGSLLARHAVNFPVVESDLRTQSKIKLGAASVTPILGSTSIKQLKEGTPIWPQLLSLAVLFALIEGFVLVKADKS